MASIVAGVACVLLGLALAFFALMSLWVEADAQAFGADVDTPLLPFTIGSVVSFALAAWLFFS